MPCLSHTLEAVKNWVVIYRSTHLDLLIMVIQIGLIFWEAEDEFNKDNVDNAMKEIDLLRLR